MSEAALQIPSVTIPPYGPYDPALVATVGEAFEQIGFVFVHAPHVTRKLPRIIRAFNTFYDLPPEVKLKHDHPEYYRERGYAPSGTEEGLFCKAIGPGGAAAADQKECYMIGPRRKPDRPELLKRWGHFYRRNTWPKEAPAFRGAMCELYDSLYPIGQRVLRVLEVYLGYPEGYFDAMLEDGPTVMRSIRYDAFGEEEVGKVLWACDHWDINLATVLPGSSQSGLMIKPRHAKDWIPGRAPDGHVVAQSGLMLQRLTGGKIHAAVHGVRAPNHAVPVGRISGAIFMHPRSDVWLGDIFAGEYLEEILRKLNLGQDAPVAH